MAGVSTAHSQDIEPRASSVAQAGVNFLIAGYADTEGDLVFNPSLLSRNPQLITHSAILWGSYKNHFLAVPFTTCRTNGTTWI